MLEYALSRAVSTGPIAEYQTRLPDRTLIRRKLHEFYQLALPKIHVEEQRVAKRRR